MTDRRRHRGPHPRDAECFATEAVPLLRQAAADLAWLLGRAYPAKAAIKLVGDRYGLRQRQRSAVQRATVGDPARERRLAGRVEAAEVAGRALLVDGYNVLLSVEAALGGGVVLGSADTAYRDMASMSSHYKRVGETRRALELIGGYLLAIGCGEAVWYLDRPISNSGRLATLMREVAEARGWSWTVDLVASPDRLLAAAGEIVATADGGILDQDVRWLNLARLVIDRHVPGAWIVDLFEPTPGDL